MKRRDLLKSAALGAAALPIGKDLVLALGAHQGATVGPSDRIRVGFIGVGCFGDGTNLPDFIKNDDVEIAAICDVYGPHEKGRLPSLVAGRG
jgi:hypothetical protein